MQKNVSSQTALFFAFNSTTNLPATGDAANILCYDSIDAGSVTLITANSGVPTEVDATNAKGYYKIALSQAETNGNVLLFSAKSSTSNIVVIGVPAVVQTVPSSFVVAPGSANALTVAGSNAATTFSGLTTGALSCTTIAASGATTLTGNVSMAAGLTITQSTANTAGLSVTGNGSGAGILSTGGAAVTTTTGGAGVSFVGGAASTSSGGTSAVGFLVTGGAGAASTNGAAGGVKFVGGGTNTVASSAHGFITTGTSTGDGLSATSGGGATGNGATFTAASTNGSGASHVSTGTGSGILTDKLTASAAVAFQSTFSVTTSTSLAALSATTITASGTTSLAAVTTSGTVTLNALTVTNNATVSGNWITSGTTTLTGAVTASNASNAITGIDVVKIRGTTSAGAAGYMGIDWSAINAPTTVVALSGTTIATVTGQLTAAAIATGVWTDTTAGDFTTALSIGKSILNGVTLGTGLTVARCTLTDTLTTYTGNTVQTGDSFARIGATGSGLTSLAPSSTALSTATWTGTLATNIGTTNTTVSTNLDAAVSSRSTLTQTQVSGGAYALNSSSFAFNSGLDFTTTQKAATLARVTLTDTASTVTDGAKSATALSTTQWTNTLATNLGTTNSTVATNLDTTISSRSTLTQTQVTGGAYSIQSASCVLGDARIADLDATVSSRAPASTALSTATWTGTLATNIGTTNATVASNLDAAVTSRMATYTQPTGFLAATFPTTVASTTNITAASGVSLAASQHVIVDSGTVTTLTNLPAIPTNWLTAAGIAASALNGKGDWLLLSDYTAPSNSSILSAIASVQSDTDDMQTRLPAALVGGRMNASVGAMAADTITASALATDAVTEIQTGLAVPGSLMGLADGAITDAKITFPAEASGRPTTFLAAMRRVWEWAANKRTRNTSTGVVSLRNATDSGDLESQTQSTSGAVDTQTKGV